MKFEYIKIVNPHEKNPGSATGSNRGDPVAQEDYARVIGCLMCITNYTRPDLACSVNKLSRYTSNPSKEHWKALVRVLRYLTYTLNHGLHYSRYRKVLEGYCDANWISDTKNSLSMSGYVFSNGVELFHGNPLNRFV
ncbi:hypothetical protein CASFOL_017295 [Castilleja foliolosa]|uniref:Zinc finger, CCHC-type n=1 Tax=Castilleja foliolosa TaxID=1961234 RepID=A0ABD3DAN2_9LAMI